MRTYLCVLMVALAGCATESLEHERQQLAGHPAEDIGTALGYADPRDAVIKLFGRNQTELEGYSCVVKLGVENVKGGGLRPQSGGAGTPSDTTEDLSAITQRRPVRVFNEEGVMILTMLSSQPKAAEFRAWAVKILKAYRHGELTLSGANRENLLITCIKEARFGNPVAIHTLIEHFGYPDKIRAEIRSDVMRRAARITDRAPELVEWFIDGFLPRLREEIEGEPGPLLAAIRGRPPGYSVWKEIESPGAHWTLRHRTSDLYTLVRPIAEAEGVEVEASSNLFTKWLAYSAGRLRAAGWERTQHSRQKGWEVYLLRLIKGG